MGPHIQPRNVLGLFKGLSRLTLYLGKTVTYYVLELSQMNEHHYFPLIKILKRSILF